MASLALPFPHSVEALRLSLREQGFDAAMVEALAAASRPAILLTTDGVAENLAPGASRIGGRPDLPPDSHWPRRPAYADAARRLSRRQFQIDRLLETARSENAWLTPEQAEGYAQEHRERMRAAQSDFPLSFLAQLDLAEMAREPGFDPAFPREGRLLFFYDLFESPAGFEPGSQVGWRLIWDRSDPAEIRPAPPPPELLATRGQPLMFPAAPVAPHCVVTPMPMNDKNWSAFPLEDERYYAYREWLNDFGFPDNSKRYNHQFGGHPQPLQNGLQARSQLAAHGIDCGGAEAWESEVAARLLPAAKDWRLVLQIGFDRHVQALSGGALYVMMRDEDIAGCRFERAWVQSQCD